MSYQITLYPTPKRAYNACLPFWSQHEIHNNLTIGLFAKAKDRDEPIVELSCFSIADEKGICATGLTSRKRWIISYSEFSAELIAILAKVISDLSIPYEGLFGEKKGTDALAHLLAPGTKPNREMMGHEILAVEDLPMASGRMVIADESHAELSADWGYRFQQELNMTPSRTPAQWLDHARERIQAGLQFCWLSEAGEVVSVCAAVRETPSAFIIGGVYTPPELRGHGYARSCVHQATAELLRRKPRCGLFTDLANPISNRIYYQIGYRPIGEFSDYVLVPPTT
jgi:RimJ/RimL family protein N-acetyltransferase